MQLTEFFEKAWQGYVQLTPDAPVVHRLLAERGETILNDHVAFRTFNIGSINRFEVGRVFEGWGYRMADEELDFPEKKLKASYWLPPSPDLPKVFVSELVVEKVSPGLQSWIREVTSPSKMRVKKLTAESLLSRTWEPVDFAQYQRFYPESEYAGWTAAYGIQVNHFTVSVNDLKTFSSLQELNRYLVDNELKLNESGGAIKGRPEDLLEQSSTLARHVPCEFAGGQRQPIMGCYYEFAKRYLMPGTQELFQGFIPKSADKIFESTYERNKK